MGQSKISLVKMEIKYAEIGIIGNWSRSWLNPKSVRAIKTHTVAVIEPEAVKINTVVSSRKFSSAISK